MFVSKKGLVVQDIFKSQNKAFRIRLQLQLKALYEKDANSYFAIQESMRDATAAIKRLATVLELGDLDSGSPAGPMIEQHLGVCELLEHLKALQETTTLEAGVSG